MVIVKSGGHEWAMDGYLHGNLMKVKELLKRDWDVPFVVDGIEGGGKSVLSMQMCKVVDPTFDLSKVCFKAEQLLDAIKIAKPFTALMFDEAYQGLSSRASMTETNRTIVSTMAEIRQKNLFVVFVLPTFFDLDRNIALWRTRALIHVYTGENLARGRFMFFNNKKKILLYSMGKKFYSYNKPAADFIGSFNDTYIIDKNEYKKLKHKALIESAQIKKQMKAEVYAKYYKKLLIGCKETLGLSTYKVGELMDCSRDTIKDHYTKMAKGIL